MKKKIAILGSTGSIGNTLLKIIKAKKNQYQILLLTSNKNYKKLIKLANEFKVRNLIITDKTTYSFVKKQSKYRNFIIHNNFENLNQIFKKKIDYVMSSISGIEGLIPTIKIIKYTKKIAIANKESIICAWDLINKELKLHNTKFIPVDSEHFSIWYALKNFSSSCINKIYITASGGPFLDYTHKRLTKVTIKDALNHPNWTMGNKISIDSATLMNKVFEIIEAKHMFNIPYDKLGIVIHPNSYIHAIIVFNNGMIKIIAHDTTMKIPISNSLIENFIYKSKEFDFNFSNFNIKFRKVDLKRFPIVKILKQLPNYNSLFETALVSINDNFVDLFLKKKISFIQISQNILKYIKLKKFLKLKKKKSFNINEILKVKKQIQSSVIN